MSRTSHREARRRNLAGDTANSIGGAIFGSNVSNCVGPPNRYRKMTDFPVVIDLFPAASARALRR